VVLWNLVSVSKEYVASIFRLKEEAKRESSLKQCSLLACCLLVSCLAYFSSLKTEAALGGVGGYRSTMTLCGRSIWNKFRSCFIFILYIYSSFSCLYFVEHFWGHLPFTRVHTATEVQGWGMALGRSGKLLLAITSTVILGSEPHGTRDPILLS
jgi:hypothetical protein